MPFWQAASVARARKVRNAGSARRMVEAPAGEPQPILHRARAACQWRRPPVTVPAPAAGAASAGRRQDDDGERWQAQRERLWLAVRGVRLGAERPEVPLAAAAVV